MPIEMTPWLTARQGDPDFARFLGAASSAEVHARIEERLKSQTADQLRAEFLEHMAAQLGVSTSAAGIQ